MPWGDAAPAGTQPGAGGTGSSSCLCHGECPRRRTQCTLFCLFSICFMVSFALLVFTSSFLLLLCKLNILEQQFSR